MSHWFGSSLKRSTNGNSNSVISQSRGVRPIGEDLGSFSTSLWKMGVSEIRKWFLDWKPNPNRTYVSCLCVLMLLDTTFDHYHCLLGKPSSRVSKQHWSCSCRCKALSAEILVLNDACLFVFHRISPGLPALLSFSHLEREYWQARV